MLLYVRCQQHQQLPRDDIILDYLDQNATNSNEIITEETEVVQEAIDDATKVAEESTTATWAMRDQPQFVAENKSEKSKSESPQEP